MFYDYQTRTHCLILTVNINKPGIASFKYNEYMFECSGREEHRHGARGPLHEEAAEIVHVALLDDAEDLRAVCLGYCLTNVTHRRSMYVYR